MGLFEFSLESMNNYGMIFDGVWLDLHHSEENEHNVETEYEQKFAAKGQPIYKLIANFESFIATSSEKVYLKVIPPLMK